jgi:hypothetical protein
MAGQSGTIALIVSLEQIMAHWFLNYEIKHQLQWTFCIAALMHLQIMPPL